MAVRGNKKGRSARLRPVLPGLAARLGIDYGFNPMRSWSAVTCTETAKYQELHFLSIRTTHLGQRLSFAVRLTKQIHAGRTTVAARIVARRLSVRRVSPGSPPAAPRLTSGAQRRIVPINLCRSTAIVAAHTVLPHQGHVTLPSPRQGRRVVERTNPL